MKTIHYICFYNKKEYSRRLNVQPPSVSKVDYILDSLKRAGYKVLLFSVAEGEKNSPFFFYKSFEKKVDCSQNNRFISTFCRKNILLIILSRIWMFIQLLKYIFFQVKKDEPILVYHSLVLRFPLNICRFFLKRKFYFEVEEIYNAAYQNKSLLIEREIKYLQKASGYILVNDLMADLCNFKSKYLVCYGCYNRNDTRKISFNDKKIHVVYAGSINYSDAFIAIDACRFLSNRYYMHILGYGTSEMIKKMTNSIEKINKEKGFEIVSYGGCLFGKEYDEFISKCDIGLCTRALQNSYSNYTFPSKVLVYMSYGVLPLSSNINCINKSKISDKLVYSKDITPSAFADAILSIPEESLTYDNSFLDELDNSFVLSLKDFFSDN